MPQTSNDTHREARERCEVRKLNSASSELHRPVKSIDLLNGVTETFRDDNADTILGTWDAKQQNLKPTFVAIFTSFELYAQGHCNRYNQHNQKLELAGNI